MERPPEPLQGFMLKKSHGRVHGFQRRFFEVRAYV